MQPVALDQLLTYEIVASFGLTMDMIGVIMLFYFGMPPRLKVPKEWEGRLFLGNPYKLILTTEGSDAEPDEQFAKWLRGRRRQYVILSNTAIILVVLGFGIQILAIICF